MNNLETEKQFAFIKAERKYTGFFKIYFILLSAFFLIFISPSSKNDPCFPICGSFTNLSLPSS
jgi:hypothetical protein